MLDAKIRQIFALSYSIVICRKLQIHTQLQKTEIYENQHLQRLYSEKNQILQTCYISAQEREHLLVCMILMRLLSRHLLVCKKTCNVAVLLHGIRNGRRQNCRRPGGSFGSNTIFSIQITVFLYVSSLLPWSGLSLGTGKVDIAKHQQLASALHCHFGTSFQLKPWKARLDPDAGGGLYNYYQMMRSYLSSVVINSYCFSNSGKNKKPKFSVLISAPPPLCLMRTSFMVATHPSAGNTQLCMVI